MKALIDADSLVWAIGCVVRDDPLENALHSMKVKLTYILSKTEVDDYQVFLSPDRNYRYDIDPNYKANRKNEKPTHFGAIREYLVNVWGAIVVPDVEADDAIGIASDPEKTIICSIDKDLDQIPGEHYNYNKDMFYYVSHDQGMRFFWEQMLTGDPSDNIKGIYGLGPVKAKRILDPIPVKDLSNTVGVQYAVHFDDPELEWEKNYKLLWILR